MSDHVWTQLSWAVMLVGVAVLQASCLETTFAPDPARQDAALVDADGANGDAGGDVAEVDAVDAAGDAADSAEPDADVTSDAADADPPETAADAADVADVADIVTLLPFEATCASDAACQSGLCLAEGTAAKRCSQVCEGDCPAGYRCGLLPSTGTKLHYCLPLPGQLCEPCAGDADCDDGLCLTDLGGAQAVCGLFCDAAHGGEAACPAGFLCQSFLKGDLCVPANGTCACGAPQLGQIWACAVQTPIGVCSGVQTCVDGGWSKCSAPVPGIEACNGADDNCDGKTDEGFALATPAGGLPLGAPCGIGACAGGQVVCGTSAAAVCSTAVKAASFDLCGDKVDNDCDGKTDEDCPEADTDGDKSPDNVDCQPYDAKAFPGAKEPCCLALAPEDSPAPVAVTSASQGCDWSCDGKIIACVSADKDGDGHAAPADCDDTDPAMFPGGKEKCGDGKDQDCDGSDLACTGLTDADGDGYPLGIDCNDDAKEIHPGAVELCNFLDDDCDAIVDEDNPGGVCAGANAKTAAACATAGGTWQAAGAACGNATGACKQGTLACLHVGLAANVTCVDAVVGAQEACNGADDDCDGATDEDFADLGATCDGSDADKCANGKRICAADGKGTSCGPEKPTDLLELCDPANKAKGNGKDDDCDGQTDEVCWSDDIDGDGHPAAVDCDDADAGVHPAVKWEPCCDPAYEGGGVAASGCDRNCDGKVVYCNEKDLDLDGKFGGDDCDESLASVYLGAVERCDDGVDQDCDGKDLKCSEITDNDADGYASAVDCNDQNDNIFPGRAELCNLKDDDCDGMTDEGNPEAAPTACGLDQGVCKPGKEVCVRQQFKAQVLCVPQQGPQAELCNGLDDNCNGATDENFADLGAACDSEDDADLCATGTWTCKADGSDRACVNEKAPHQTELCDSLDNDCDGATDEGMAYFGKSIGGACDGQGACGAGTVVCSPELAVAVCSTDLYGTQPESKPEICNGIDDDCDGLTDEGLLFGGKGIGAACSGTGACASKTGKIECGPDGAAICSTMPGGTAYAGSAEVCNNVDDDCDGRVDEGLGIADSNCKVKGLCSASTVKAQCLAGLWKCEYSGVSGYQGDKEVLCDGLDNDCDGKVDEEFLVGAPCDSPEDSDLCANGVNVCAADKLSSTCGPESPANIVDICNGKDDDCDGKTDEDFPVGEACDGDDADACPTGTWTCKADGSKAECVNEPPSDKSELCNGKDDDCDGKADEDFALGEACDGGDSDKCKNGTLLCAADGKGTTCGTETVSDIAEICNGNDDDCDGAVDEEQLYEGKGLEASCKGIGDCGSGKVVCSPVNQKATCSTNPDAFLIFDGKELCDGLDNDCNGKIDDALTWKGIAKGGSCPGVGACGQGTVECGGDKQVTCSTLANGTQSQAKPELCDGIDNDCNGQVDDGLGLAQSNCAKVGVCTPEAVIATCSGGKWACDYSKITKWQAVETLCDGLDNDCDGQTDEGFDIGKACDGDDSDQCKNGTFTCASDGKKAVCTNEVMESIPEVCDGLDNDCDGFQDENFTYNEVVLGGPCDGVGECGSGTVVCGALTKVAVCSSDADGSAPQAKPEICDNKDNDCNGVTDNDMKFQGLPKGAPCTGVGECGLGAVECHPIKKVAVCSSNPDGTESKSIFEQCNGKDDDCDGQSDEQVDPSSNTCNKQGACAKALVPTCSAGKWQCVFSGAGWQKEETLCDDIDNDCNGITDDPFPTKGKACDGPDADVCANGKLVCAASKAALECGPEATASTKEVCDGVDNDCNGQTDEAFPTLGQTCDGGDTDQCKNGLLVCSAAGDKAECGEEFPTNIKEICDGIDNDCDGQTDEGYDVGAPCDGPDLDQCKLGKIQCDKQGKAECGAEAKTNKEACNDIDDDCDGTTDEGFEQKGQKCDSPADTDVCKTGLYACNSGILVCSGDVECAVGAACAKSANLSTPETCQCGPSATCSFSSGDECNAGKCTCNGGASCSGKQMCVSGKGCQ